jgi:hypothetical protein
MAWSSQVQGLDEVIRNLNIEIAKIKGATKQGLIKSFALIRYNTEHTPPLTPVDLGNLRASWFVVTATSVPVGRGTEQFKGLKAAEMLSDHASTIQECQEIAKSDAIKKIIVIGGYSANYAVYVHEMLGTESGKEIMWSRPGSGAKWLEWAFTRCSGDILVIIAENARVR